MKTPRVGLWLVGAHGGVATTAALGLAALRRGLIDQTSLVTALPLFDGLGLDPLDDFVVGGHDVRRTSYRQAVHDLQQRSNIFEASLADACLPDLDAWSENVRVGTVFNSGATITKMADIPEAHRADSGRAAIERIQADLREFQERHHLDQVVVVNVSSTEPPFALGDIHASPERLANALERRGQAVLPASSLYASATLDLGWPFINFT